MLTKQQHRTRSAGTKLSHDQYAALQARADAQGLGISEYIREVLLSASSLMDYVHRLEALCQTQLTETVAIRSIMLNLAGLQANDTPLTPALLEEVRAHADAFKFERARLLAQSTTTTNPTKLAASSDNKEAA